METETLNVATLKIQRLEQFRLNIVQKTVLIAAQLQFKRGTDYAAFGQPGFLL